MKQYLLSVHHDGDFPQPEPEVMQQMFAAVEEFNRELQASGAWVFAGGLHPKDSATTIRYRDGSTLVTDGPWSETKERGARACMGDVEVRPFQGE